MSYIFLDTPTVEIFGNNIDDVRELVAVARELNVMTGKRDIFEFEKVMLAQVSSDKLVNLMYAIVSDEMTAHRLSHINTRPIRVEGLLARVEAQIARRKV